MGALGRRTKIMVESIHVRLQWMMTPKVSYANEPDRKELMTKQWNYQAETFAPETYNPFCATGSRSGAGRRGCDRRLQMQRRSRKWAESCAR